MNMTHFRIPLKRKMATAKLMKKHYYHIHDKVTVLSKSSYARAVHGALCYDQHVKNWMPGGFPLTSNLLLDYHIKQHIADTYI